MGTQTSTVSGSPAVDSSSSPAAAIVKQQNYQGRIHNRILNKKSFRYEKLESIFFCEQLASNILGAVDHAYLIVETDLSNLYLCEIGGDKNNVQLIIKRFFGKLDFQFRAQGINKNKTLKDLIDFSKQQWTNQTYNVLTKNCYDYCKSILQEFTNGSHNSSLVTEQEQQSMALGVAHLGGITYGAYKGFSMGQPYGLISAVVGALVGGFTGFKVVNVTSR